MKKHGKDAGRRLDEAFKRFDQVSVEGIAEAQKQTLEYLELQTRAHAEARMQDSPPVRIPRTSQSFRFAAVAVVAVAAVTLSTAFVRTHWGSDRPAVVQTAGGDLFRVTGETAEVLRGGASIEFGETIRSGGRSGTILGLKEGSAVEMRPESELTLEAADDGLRIRLNAGNIIVTAAKQRNGHLGVRRGHSVSCQCRRGRLARGSYRGRSSCTPRPDRTNIVSGRTTCDEPLDGKIGKSGDFLGAER
jgi:ferric-dicitrate binding protein FerR (iron transport regulator)